MANDPEIEKMFEPMMENVKRRSEIGNEYGTRMIEGNVLEAAGRLADDTFEKKGFRRVGKAVKGIAKFVKATLDKAEEPLPEEGRWVAKQEQKKGWYRGEPAPNAKAAFSAVRIDEVDQLGEVGPRVASEHVNNVISERVIKAGYNDEGNEPGNKLAR